MDVTASTLTIVASVWTLTIHGNQIIRDLKNFEERVKERERKARSFVTVIGQIINTYGLDAADPKDPSIGPHERAIRDNLRNELKHCERDLKAYEGEVQKLNKQKTTKNYGGLVFNSWKEKMALPKLEEIEKSIADHQTQLQALIELYNGQKLGKTQKDIDQILTKVDQICRMIMQLLSPQGVNGRNNSMVGGSPLLDRRDSNVTLVNPAEETNEETLTTAEGENFNSWQSLAGDFVKEVMSHMSSIKGSLQAPPDQFRSPFDPATNGRGSFSDSTTNVGSDTTASRFSGSSDASGRFRGSFTKTQDLNDSGAPLLRPITASSLPVSDSSDSSGLHPTISARSGSFAMPQRPSDDSSGPRRVSQTPQENAQGTQNEDGGAELFEAIKVGSDDALQRLLQNKPSLEARDKRGKTPLILAASLGKATAVEDLLANGADLHAVDDNNSTALHRAIERSAWPVMSLLLEAEKNPSMGEDSCLLINFSDKRGRTPLHCCTSLGFAEDVVRVAVEKLISYKADINAEDKADKPPVYYAIKDRRYSVVELFLEGGANLDFERPDTSNEVGKLIDDHVAGKRRAPSMNDQETKMARIKTEDRSGSPKSRKFSIRSRRSSSKACIYGSAHSEARE